MNSGEITVKPEDAHLAMARLVEQLLALPVDFSDIPVIPEKLASADAETLKRASALASAGDLKAAVSAASGGFGESFEFDYLMGKIALSSRLYFEASKFFNLAVIKFQSYGELWFLYGACLYQTGLYSEAFMLWREALRANENHQDARILLQLANMMIEKTHPHLNPEAEFVLPVVSGRGIDVGCGGAKTHPAAIGVDIIPPGQAGAEASQKGRVSQADVEASGDDLSMFADGELDYVIARHNLEHYVDPFKTLLEWRRVLKPGGVIALVLPDDDEFDTLRADPTHLHVFTKSSICNMVSLIDGLKVAAIGTSRHKWSFYAIIEKTLPGQKPKYRFGEALNAWLAHSVAHRTKSAITASVNDVASASLKKLAELAPGTRLMADPDKLWPNNLDGLEIPFTHGQLGRRVAMFGGSGDGLRSLIIQSGAWAEILPFVESGPASWQTEKLLREYAPEYLVSRHFEPKIATYASDSRTPAIFWLSAPVTDERKTRMDFDLTHSMIFAEIRGETDKFRRMGAKHIHYAPSPHDENVFNAGSASREIDVAIQTLDDSSTRYFLLMERLRERLSAKDSTVDDKNAIFALVRKFGMAMDSFMENPFQPDSGRKLREMIDGMNLPCFALTADEVYYTLAEESALRYLPPLAENSGAKIVKTSTTADRAALFNNAKIMIAFTPPSHWDSLPKSALEAMACGALLLVNETPGMKEFFSDGEGLVYYRSLDEVQPLVSHYLANEVERSEIAAAGRAKLANHTIKYRWNEILTKADELSKEIR